MCPNYSQGGFDDVKSEDARYQQFTNSWKLNM